MCVCVFHAPEGFAEVGHAGENGATEGWGVGTVRVSIMDKNGTIRRGGEKDGGR